MLGKHFMCTRFLKSATTVSSTPVISTSLWMLMCTHTLAGFHACGGYRCMAFTLGTTYLPYIDVANSF